MIGLGLIAYILPEGRISNADRLQKFQASEALLRDKIGVEHVSVKPAEQETSDMCVAVARNLFDTGAVTPKRKLAGKFPCSATQLLPLKKFRGMSRLRSSMCPAP